MGLRKKKNAKPEVVAAPTPALEELKAQLAEVEAELSAVDEEFESVKAELRRVQANADGDADIVADDMERRYIDSLENKEAFSKFLDQTYKAKLPTDTVLKQTLLKLNGIARAVNKRRHCLMVDADRLRRQINDEENKKRCDEIIKTTTALIDYLREGLSKWRDLKKLRLGLNEKFLLNYLEKSSDPWAKYYMHVLLSGLKIQYLPDMGISDFTRYCMQMRIDSPSGKAILEEDPVEINASKQHRRHLTEQGIVTGNRYNIESR